MVKDISQVQSPQQVKAIPPKGNPVCFLVAPSPGLGFQLKIGQKTEETSEIDDCQPTGGWEKLLEK